MPTYKHTHLDRFDVCAALYDLFVNDSILYGSSGYLQSIEYDPVKFDQAKSDNNKPVCLYMWARSEGTTEYRMQNTDERYTINLRFAGTKSDLTNLIRIIDDAYERIKKLVNTVIFNGNLLDGIECGSYINGSDYDRIINLGINESEFTEPVIEGDRFICDCSGSIYIDVNRLIQTN